MKISNVNVTLKSEDIISIFQEFVHVKGLSLKEIILSEGITVKGEYKAFIKITFDIRLFLKDVKYNKINMDIDKISIGKIKIWRFIRRKALKAVVNNLKEQGIGLDIEKDILSIDLDSILKTLPISLGLSLKTLEVRNESIYAEAYDINFSMNKDIECEKAEDEKQEEEKALPVVKKNDGYTRIREKALENIPDKYKDLKQYISIVPDFIAMFYRIFRDPRVDSKTKVVVASALGYLSLPIDLIPDKIPFIGKIDDLAIIFCVLNKIVNDIPENIILENWQGKDDVIKLIKQGVNYANEAFGGENLVNMLKKIQSFA